MKTLLQTTLVLLLAVGLVGCVKIKQAWQIQPDGSGKLTVSVAVSQQVLQMAGDDDPFADLTNPKDMISQADNGWVAFTEPQVETRDGFKYATFTGYFENINDVVYRGDGGEGEMQASTYRFDPAGKFTVRDPMLAQVIDSVAGDPSLSDPQQKAMMAPMMKGLEISESYTLPGNIADAEGYQVDGRSATTSVDETVLLAEQAPSIPGLDDHQLVVTFEPADWEQGQEDAWYQELEAAKVEWEAIKQRVADEAETPAMAE